MTTISANLQAVRARIEAATRAAGRKPGSVQLLAVSKTFSPQDIRLAVEAGQRCFGESYVQEATAKIEALREHSLEWHFIGPLQSNKTRQVAALFDWVHSVDRLKIAERLSEARNADQTPLQVCIQVNVSGEASKSGIAPGGLPALARAVSKLPRLKLRGLMAIPELTDDVALAHRRFASLRTLRDALNCEGMECDTLSMGMSHDLDVAILEGATLVRVGAAIFGERKWG